MPLVSTHVVVLAILVEVLCIISPNDVDAILLALIDGREITPCVVQIRLMLQALVLFDILQHPIAAHVVLVPPRDAEELSVVRDDRPTELRDVVVEVDQILALLVRRHVVKVDVLVAPLKVMDDPLVSELLLEDEDVLEKLNDAFLDVEVVELGDHRLLLLEIASVLRDHRVPFVDDHPDVVENSDVARRLRPL